MFSQIQLNELFSFQKLQYDSSWHTQPMIASENSTLSGMLMSVLNVL